ncbi:unnamed protein product [Prunus brigantina]
MKGFMVFLMLAMLIASAITTLSAIPDEEESFFNEENNTDAKDETKNQFGKSTSLRSRFLAYGKCGWKCNYSEICCEGKCVNPNSDNENCGSCNNACKKGTSCARAHYGFSHYSLCNGTKPKSSILQARIVNKPVPCLSVVSRSGWMRPKPSCL